MSYGTDALYDFAAQDPRRFTSLTIPQRPSLLPQNILGSLALTFMVAACLWTIGSHLTREESLTIEARFGGLPSGLAASPAPRASIVRKGPEQRFAGLFDARRMSGARGTFTGGQSPPLAHQLAQVATPGAPQLQVAGLQPHLSVRQVASSIPLPAPRPSALASLQETAASTKPLVPMPRVLVEDKATVLALISSNNSSPLFQKLFGKPNAEGAMLAYAGPDGGIASDMPNILFDGMPKYDQWTAVYDITARRVYLPDGTELEAHSGLGSRMDDPRHVHIKMHGATPPHVYDLSMRESLFHGVEALRMTPVGGEGRIFGRTGILAHTYMLGPRGDSNGCVSLKDYATFLRAYKSGSIKRVVVVSRLS